MQDLEGKVAIVTGAASGIGKAVATSLAGAGMRVALADIEADALNEVADALTADGHDVLAVATDVSSKRSLQALADAVMSRWGALHVVHNNAGVVRAGPITEISDTTWKWVLGVDLWSVIWGIQIFVPLIRTSGGGHVVSTASVAGLQAGNQIAPYNVAKSGVIALSESLKMELDNAGEPIDVSVLCPGAVNTQIVRSDRNAPSEVATDERGVDQHLQFKERAGAQLAKGMDPDDVAAIVLDGIRTNKFWLLTHPGWHEVMERRVAGMADGQLVQNHGG